MAHTAPSEAAAAPRSSKESEPNWRNGDAVTRGDGLAQRHAALDGRRGMGVHLDRTHLTQSTVMRGDAIVESVRFAVIASPTLRRGTCPLVVNQDSIHKDGRHTSALAATCLSALARNGNSPLHQRPIVAVIFLRQLYWPSPDLGSVRPAVLMSHASRSASSALIAFS